MREFQHKPEKKLTYRQKVLAGKVTQFGRGPRGKLKQRSPKQKARMKAYADYINGILLLPEYQRCNICGSKENLEFHHPSGRYGKNLFNVMRLCSKHHAWVHENMNAALEQGYITENYRKKLT